MTHVDFGVQMATFACGEMAEHGGESHLRRGQDGFVAFGYPDAVKAGWKFVIVRFRGFAVFF